MMERSLEKHVVPHIECARGCLAVCQGGSGWSCAGEGGSGGQSGSVPGGVF